MRIFHFQRFISIFCGMLKYTAFGIVMYVIYISGNANQITIDPTYNVHRVAGRSDKGHAGKHQLEPGREYSDYLNRENVIKAIRKNETSIRRHRTGETPDVVIVTAASARYFQALKNFVGSVHYWDRKRRIAVFNIGLTSFQVDQIQYWCNVDLHWKWGIPGHKRMASKDPWKFSWKPFVIAEALDTYSTILYSDAGSDVRAPLAPIDNILLEDKYFFVNGQDLDMTSLGHEETFKYFGKDKFQAMFKNKPSYAGGLQGYVKTYKTDKFIIKPLIKCARSSRCISPKGSSTENHRYDQTALSIILYSSGLHITSHTELITTSKEHLNSDPLRKSKYIIYTGRKTSNDYVGKLCFNRVKMIPITKPKMENQDTTRQLSNNQNADEIEIRDTPDRLRPTHAPKGKWINHNIFQRAQL